MAIQNSIGYTGFSRDFHTPPEGHVFDIHGVLARAYRNRQLAQISTVTITGFGADADSVSVLITLPTGTVITVTTTRAAAVPVDDAAAAAALVVLINAHASLYGHVVATSALGVLTLTFEHTGQAYAVTTSVTAAVATVATTQTAGGTIQAFGRFVAAATVTAGPQPALRVLTGTDRDTQIRGIVARPQVALNLASGLATDTDGVPVGDMADVVYDGHIAMRNNGSVAAIPGGQVFAVVSTTGGDEIGEARADGSGVAHVSTITAIADAQVYAVKAVIYVNGERRELEFSYAPTDGTTTTDLAIDGMEAAAAAAIIAQGFTGIVSASTASAAATMTLTAAAGYAFEFVDGTAFFEDASAEAMTVSTAATVLYAIPLDPTRFYWAEAVAVGGIGPVMCRC